MPLRFSPDQTSRKFASTPPCSSLSAAGSTFSGSFTENKATARTTSMRRAPATKGAERPRLSKRIPPPKRAMAAPIPPMRLMMPLA